MRGRLGYILCILIAFCAAAPGSGVAINATASSSLPTGITLHVGGSGPGNYTSIQQAINHASTGDTVYVYNDSAPYHESVLVNKTIHLIGEQKETTVIDGSGHIADLITVTAPQVVIQGFTLIHSGRDALVIHQDGATISNLIISNCTQHGVYVYKSGENPTNRCTIRDCTITGTTDGVIALVCNRTLITHDTIRGNHAGITLTNSFFNNISFNDIDGNEYGIVDSFSSNNLFLRNRIANNSRGMELLATRRDTVQQNTFRDNTVQAWFVQYPAFQMLTKLNAMSRGDMFFARNYRIIGRTSWHGNYWNESRTLPYPIHGHSGLLLAQQEQANRVEYDWNPASQPIAGV